MNTVQCFNKKKVTSTKTGEPKTYYFLAIRDSEGYAGDQIVSETCFNNVNPPCDVEYRINCSGARPRVEFRQAVK